MRSAGAEKLIETEVEEDLSFTREEAMSGLVDATMNIIWRYGSAKLAIETLENVEKQLRNQRGMSTLAGVTEEEKPPRAQT